MFFDLPMDVIRNIYEFIIRYNREGKDLIKPSLTKILKTKPSSINKLSPKEEITVNIGIKKPKINPKPPISCDIPTINLNLEIFHLSNSFIIISDLNDKKP